MTIRFLGLSDEQRLAIEETTGIKTEGAQMIVDAAVAQANDMMSKTIREVQEVVGPHGSVTRLQAGGVRITPSGGIGVFEDGVLKTTVEPDGDFLAGSDITNPANTTFAVFVNEQTYNNEAMGAGDLLIGDNTTDASNVKYDASEGQLQFRLGSTVNVYMDTDGTLKAGAGGVAINSQGIIFENNSGTLYFKNAAGQALAFIYGSNNDDIVIQNSNVGKPVLVRAKTTDGTSVVLTFRENPSVANASQLDVSIGPDGGVISIGGGVSIWAHKDGKETVFNEDSYDIDFRIESATNASAFILNAGSELISMLGDFVFDGGSEHRLEIGADHYIPTRNASNKTTIFNEANQDMDFNVQGDTDSDLLFVDASTDRIGIGTAAPDTKLHVNGTMKASSVVWDGWTADTNTWSYSSVDDPTGIITVNADVTGLIGIKDRIRFVNGGNTIYGIVTVAPSFGSGVTTIKFLHQIDPTDSLALVLMANSAITAPYYSHMANPFGFPPQEDKWTVYVQQTSNQTVSSGTSAYQNIGSLSINIPIGLWSVSYNVLVAAIKATAATLQPTTTLSTTTTTATDARFTETSTIIQGTFFAATHHPRDLLSLTSKTTYYLNGASLSFAVDSVTFYGSLATTQIKCVCAYL